jgi:DNA replication protein DnaC
MYNTLLSLSGASAALVLALERLREVGMNVPDQPSALPASYEKYHEAFRDYQFYNSEFHEVRRALRALPGFKAAEELMHKATSTLQEAIAAASQDSNSSTTIERLEEAILALQTALSRVKAPHYRDTVRGAGVSLASSLDKLVQWAQVVHAEIAKHAASTGVSADEAYTEANTRYQSALLEVQEADQELRGIACSEKQSVWQALHKATEDLINVVQTSVASLGHELPRDWLTFITTVPRVKSQQAIDLFMKFKFELNGTIERERLVQLFNMNYLQAGVNLAILGGIGTGRSTIAKALMAEAQATGRTTERLLYHGYCNSSSDLGNLHATTQNQPFRFHDSLVDCDLLMVDEASTRLRDPHAVRFLALIALRTEWKRSTILIMDSRPDQTTSTTPELQAMEYMQQVLYTGETNVRRRCP